jgi:hexokinase
MTQLNVPWRLSLSVRVSCAGKYLFEKLVSGMFIGEVARRILLTLAAETKLFGDYSTSTVGVLWGGKLKKMQFFMRVTLTASVVSL